MSDLFNRLTENQDVIKKLLSKIPGFDGYIERQNRRATDKILREAIADGFEELWQKISSVQIELLNSGGLIYVDDVERAAIKIRQFIDRIRHASYGYAPFFDAVKIREEQLAKVYEYDLALFNSKDEVGRAIENLEASINTDGFPAALRHLTTISQMAVDSFNNRSEVLMGGIDGGDEVQ